MANILTGKNLVDLELLNFHSRSAIFSPASQVLAFSDGLRRETMSALLTFCVEQELTVFDSSVPSALAVVRCCKRTWERTPWMVLCRLHSYVAPVDHKMTPAQGYRVGLRVWLSRKTLPLPVESWKSSSRFVGPFPITKVVNPVTTRLRLPKSMPIHPTFHVSPLGCTRWSCLPGPLLTAGSGPGLCCAGLLSLRRWGRGVQYSTDLKGYSPKERLWVYSQFIVGPSLIRDLYAVHPEDAWAIRSRLLGGGMWVLSWAYPSSTSCAPAPVSRWAHLLLVHTNYHQYLLPCKWSCPSPDCCTLSSSSHITLSHVTDLVD
ncbi:uncharacterized protein LOC133510207 [Syngnathoides biaculeatus]|uniref:uncharacterized protein LOC133510207 n=1 Tax=Syngnathoides biaculeatus TaxID=300417 RepID=UPI002ADDB4C9|nr:uncharacterized protein LOC133510207 [Syngnathoides biaculeatus]